MWNILNKNRCETLADILKDSIKYEKDWFDTIIKTLSSDYKDSLESGDLICLSRGSLYYLSWIEENGLISSRKYDEKEKKYYMDSMEWLGYLFQSWYEDFGVTGKDIVGKLKDSDYIWLNEHFAVLHTQDTKYVFEEMKKTRNIEF